MTHPPRNDWGPLEPLEDRSYARPQQAVRQPRKRAGLGRILALGAIAVTFLGKAKYLAFLPKLIGPVGSMLLTVWIYALVLGWPFAVGFVALIFVHEMGHALALRQQGIPSGAPVFIPFVGAFIAMKGRPRDAFIEAIVGIGGPLLGTLGAAACFAAGLAIGSDFLIALASVGFLINLFNMIPISPLDGGRIAGAISRWFWFVGYAIGIGVFLLTWSPILAIILIVGLFTIWQNFKRPVPGYYEIAPWKRVAMGAGYFGLLAFLAVAMVVSESLVRHLLPSQQALALSAGAAIHVFGSALGERQERRAVPAES